MQSKVIKICFILFIIININKVFSKELDEQTISETRNYLNAFDYKGKGVITSEDGYDIRVDGMWLYEIEDILSSATYISANPSKLIVVVDNKERCVKCTQNIGCDDVYYYKINKKTGKGIKLSGSSETVIFNNLGMRGYKFKDGNKKYEYNLYPHVIFIRY